MAPGKDFVHPKTTNDFPKLNNKGTGPKGKESWRAFAIENKVDPLALLGAYHDILKTLPKKQQAHRDNMRLAISISSALFAELDIIKGKNKRMGADCQADLDTICDTVIHKLQGLQEDFEAADLPQPTHDLLAFSLLQNNVAAIQAALLPSEREAIYRQVCDARRTEALHNLN